MNNVNFRRFIAQHFNLTVEVFYNIKFAFKKFDLPPIIILTPGKVGSSSVYYTLKKKVKNQVFHIHNISPHGIEKSVTQHLLSDRKSRPLHLIISKLLVKKLRKYNGKLYIITIVREPISRAVSSFFQNTEFHKNEIEKKGLKIDETKALSYLMEDIEDDITKKLESWFNDELKGTFGINVFKKPFDRHKNYNVTCVDQNYHLTIRMEDLDQIFPTAIQDFLKLHEPIDLINSNVGAQKHYADSYKTIKKNLKLSSENLQQIVSSKYFQHFYKEREGIVKEKWQES